MAREEARVRTMLVTAGPAGMRQSATGVFCLLHLPPDPAPGRLWRRRDSAVSGQSHGPEDKGPSFHFFSMFGI